LHSLDGAKGYPPVARVLVDAVEAPYDHDASISVTTIEILSDRDSAQAVGLVLSNHGASWGYRRVGLFWTSSSRCQKGAVCEWLSVFKEDTLLII
jgi:hypothetical protein